MSTSPKSPPTWLAWLPVIATLFLIGGFLLSTGGTLQKIDDHETRITKLEAKSDSDADKLDKINERTARIEAKLEVLVPTNSSREQMK